MKVENMEALIEEFEKRMRRDRYCGRLEREMKRKES